MESVIIQASINVSNDNNTLWPATDILYPPSQFYMIAGCFNRKKLMKATQRPAILYILGKSPITTYSVALKCDHKLAVLQL
jgi:hypothetical protein